MRLGKTAPENYIHVITQLLVAGNSRNFHAYFILPIFSDNFIPYIASQMLIYIYIHISYIIHCTNTCIYMHAHTCAVSKPSLREARPYQHPFAVVLFYRSRCIARNSVNITSVFMQGIQSGTDACETNDTPFRRECNDTSVRSPTVQLFVFYFLARARSRFKQRRVTSYGV